MFILCCLSQFLQTLKLTPTDLDCLWLETRHFQRLLLRLFGWMPQQSLQAAREDEERVLDASSVSIYVLTILPIWQLFLFGAVNEVWSSSALAEYPI